MATTKESATLLSSCGSDILERFLNLSVNDLVGANGKLTDDYSAFPSDLGWSQQEVLNTRRWIQNLYRDCILKKRDLSALEVPDQVREALDQCLKTRYKLIYQLVAKESLLDSGVTNLVENIDWKLKWIMGSSKLSSIKEPLLELDLNCVEKDDKGEIADHCVSCEMSLDQVDKLINNLEQAKLQLQDKP